MNLGSIYSCFVPFHNRCFGLLVEFITVHGAGNHALLGGGKLLDNVEIIAFFLLF